jgi:purine-nucleoside phosphorylase
VSDLIRTGEALSPAERQTSFDEMIALALETAFGSAG